MKWQESIPSGGIDFFAKRDSHSSSGRCCVCTNSMRIFLTMRCYEDCSSERGVWIEKHIIPGKVRMAGKKVV